MQFISSPFAQYDPDREPHLVFANKLIYDLDCFVFRRYNGTNSNLVMHHSFKKGVLRPDSVENWWDWSKPEHENFEIIRNQHMKVDPGKHYDLVINRTQTNQQYFKLKLSEDLKYIQVVNNKLYHHHPPLSKPVSTNLEYFVFMNDRNTTILLETESQIIGEDIYNPISLYSDPEDTIYQEIEPVEWILGIPIKYKDKVDRAMKFVRIAAQIVPVKVEQVMAIAYQEKQPLSQLIQFQIDFNLMEQTKVYNGLSDVISEIGGVGSSIQMGLGFLSFGFILFYVLELSKLIRRKNEHQLRKAYINRNKIRLIRIFNKKIKELQSQPAEKWDNKLLRQYEYELERLNAIDKYKLYKDSIVFEKDIRELKHLYYADFEEDKNFHKLDDELEIAQLKDLYKKRSDQGLIEIAEDIKQRVSIYEIFNMANKQQQHAIKLNCLKKTLLEERSERKYQFKAEQDKRMHYSSKMQIVMKDLKTRIRIQELTEQLKQKEIQELKEILNISNGVGQNSKDIIISQFDEWRKRATVKFD